MEEMNGNSSAIYLPGAYSPAKARKVYANKKICIRVWGLWMIFI